MKKIFTYILFMIIGFVCFTSNVYATFEKELINSSGKTATYKITSSIKYSTVTTQNPVGLTVDSFVWNSDGLTGKLVVTFTTPDCTGSVDLKTEASEGCEEVTPKNCDAILADARSMIGRIPYELGGKCAVTSYDQCQFNRIWTSKYPHIPYVTSNTPDKYPANLTRHGDGKGHTGLDCSGFVWWIFYRAGMDLVGNSTPYMSAMYSGVSNITSSSAVYSIPKEKAAPCDLVSSFKPDNAQMPHIGIVSQVAGGMMFIHENGTNDNVAENCYFDCQAPAQGKGVKYWRVKALWDGSESSSTNTCSGVETLQLDNSEHCTCDTCDEIVITPEHIDESSYYNNCCLDGNSHLKEYRISELFCSEENKDLEIQYYNDQCNNDAYEDDTFDTLLEGNQYCRVYCTEELDIQVPPPIESASGKFFKLAELEYKDLNNETKVTKAPVVSGSKACTIKVDYAQWRKKYINTVKEEVENFNNSQMNAALYEITRNPKVTTETLNNTVNFKCTANDATEKNKDVSNGAEYLDASGNKVKCTQSTCNVPAYVGNGESYMNSSKETVTCSSAACREYEVKTSNPSTTCQNTYTLYTVNTAGKTGISCSGGKCSLSYQQVKIEGNLDTEKGKNFKGIKIVSDGTKTATYEEKTAKAGNDGCTSALESFKNSQTGYTCEQVGGAPRIPDGIKEANMEEAAKQFSDSAYTQAQEQGNKTELAIKLEDAMKTCQNMFDSEEYAMEGDKTEPDKVYETSKFYNLNPSLSFNYMQVYLDNDKKVGDWQEVNYSINQCQYKFSNTHVSDIDEPKVIYYSSRFGTDDENMRDMLPIPVPGTKTDIRPIKDTELKDYLDTDTSGKIVSKKFRRDAQYNALCTWDGEDIPTKYTLYPGPIAKDTQTEAGEKEISGHKYQYALYLTTYQAEYETYWKLTNLGGSNRTVEKFMKYFNSDASKTCADYNSEKGTRAYSNGKEKSPEDNRKKAQSDPTSNASFTCLIDVNVGGMRIGSCTNGIYDENENEKCVEAGVKEVFEFKVVDPKDMFPGDWTDKAHNWKAEDGSWGTTYSAIDNTADTDETYSPSKLTYSYKLDTKTIKAIKDYNNEHQYTYTKTAASEDDEDRELVCKCPVDVYSSEEDQIDTTDCGTIKKPASDECTTIINNKKKWKYTCRECESSFLTNLSNNNKVRVKGVDIEVSNVWNNSNKSFDDVRKNNNWA